ncbi:MAG: ABC transporter ATP-binding protein [Eubacteriales bacterium]|nr:ABC transporter ATP-binding protein [Eubacteriales bacterium]
MKLKKIRVKSDISEAAEILEPQLSKRMEARDIYNYQLIFEELAVRLLDMGVPEISTFYGSGRNGFYIDLEVKNGKRCDIFEDKREVADQDEEQETLLQLSNRILSLYSSCIKYIYKNGCNYYRINLMAHEKSEMVDEIIDYYENDPSPNKNILKCIARNHYTTLLISIINKAVKHGTIAMIPIFTSKVIDYVLEIESFMDPRVLACIAAAFGSIALHMVCLRLETVVFKSFMHSTENGLKRALIKKLQRLSITFHNGMQSGKIISKLLMDTQDVVDLIRKVLANGIDISIDFIVVITVSILYCPQVLLLYLVIAPIAVLVLCRFKNKIRVANRDYRIRKENASASINEMLMLTGLSRVHGIQKTEYEKISRNLDHVLSTANSFDAVNNELELMSFGVMQFFQLLTFSFAAFMAFQGYITVGSVVLFNSYFTTIVNAMVKLMEQMPDIAKGAESLSSINEIMLADDFEDEGHEKLPADARGNIEFKDVSFSYESSGAVILKDVSFRIEAGSTVAFVGGSGSGKSTMLNLLTGLLPVTAGEILIEGMPIFTLNKESYRRIIAMVPQNSVLFAGTLWDNLTYGLDYVASEDVLRVLEQVKLADLLESLPDGLNTFINENGSNLSGGQKQRISIARALLRKPRILLLDEATSALDEESERHIKNTIDSLKDKCTVIIVAHRLSTIENTDVIYELQGGSLKRYDTFKDYMDKRI